MQYRNKKTGLPGIIYGACLLAGFMALVLARLPNIIGQGGRFWAEEGVIYVSNAWILPWWQAWFAIHTGYINLIAGVATWLGVKLGGIAHAPLITVLISLLVQALPPFIMLTHDFPWRRSRLTSLAAVALCALPPVTGEVWLNSITGQFHFALAASLILASPAERRGLLALDAAILAIAVLSGPATSFLMPLFLLRGVVTRRRTDLLLLAVILAGFCIQASVYLTHLEPARNGHLSVPQLFSAIALHVIALSFAGYGLAGRFSEYLLALHAEQRFLWPGPLIVLLFYGGMIWAVARCGRYTRMLALLLAAQALFAFVSFDHALFGDFDSIMEVTFGQRYAFVPMVLTGLILIGCACAASGWRRIICIAMTLLLLATGLGSFRAGTTLFNNGPAWTPQIAAWKKDPQMVLTVWPGPSWYMRLPKDKK